MTEVKSAVPGTHWFAIRDLISPALHRLEQLHEHVEVIEQSPILTLSMAPSIALPQMDYTDRAALHALDKKQRVETISRLKHMQTKDRGDFHTDFMANHKLPHTIKSPAGLHASI